MCRRGGMVDTAACEAVERKLVGVRIPLAKLRVFPSGRLSDSTFGLLTLISWDAQM